MNKELLIPSTQQYNYNINIEYDFSKQRYMYDTEDILFKLVNIEFELVQGIYNVNIKIVVINELALKIIQNCICFSDNDDQSNCLQDTFEYLRSQKINEIEYHGTKLSCNFSSDLPTIFDRNVIPTVIIDRLYFIKTNFNLLKDGIYQPHHYQPF